MLISDWSQTYALPILWTQNLFNKQYAQVAFKSPCQEGATSAGTHADDDLDARRHERLGIRGRRARTTQVLVQQILELGALALECRRAHVGDVVRDDLDIELLGHHAGRAGAEGTHG